MELAFVKMHGAGNDFMVARWPDGTSLPDAATVRGWADRRSGVGFDQLLLVRPVPTPVWTRSIIYSTLTVRKCSSAATACVVSPGSCRRTERGIP